MLIILLHQMNFQSNLLLIYKTTQMKTSNRSLLTGGLCMQVEIKIISMVTIIIT